MLCHWFMFWNQLIWWRDTTKIPYHRWWLATDWKESQGHQLCCTRRSTVRSLSHTHAHFKRCAICIMNFHFLLTPIRNSWCCDYCAIHLVDFLSCHATLETCGCGELHNFNYSFWVSYWYIGRGTKFALEDSSFEVSKIFSFYFYLCRTSRDYYVSEYCFFVFKINSLSFT